MTDIILQGVFMIFDVIDTRTKTECRTTPRQVKVTFEKTLINESYCLRLLDPTGKSKPFYYHLDKTVFCGTDWGDLNLTKPYMFCLKRQIRYKFLTVFIGSEHSQNCTSCVLLRTEWDKDDQKRWQNIINEKLGLNEIWSVRNSNGRGKEKRVLLCLTEQILALNSKDFNSSTVLPKCMWYCNFSHFTIVPTFNEQTEALNIVCTRKTTGRTCPTDRRTYEVLTRRGRDIVRAINRASRLKLLIPNPVQTVLLPSHTNEEARPPPCTNGQTFFITPTPSPTDTFMRSLPLPPPPNPDSSDEDSPCTGRPLGTRRKAVKPSHSRSLRRSFSLGEKQYKSSINRTKVMLRDKVSLSGGYGSDTEDNYQMPTITHPSADRQTLYIHNRWYQQFKEEVGDEAAPPRPPSKKAPRPISIDEEHYWTTEMSFSLQEILEKKIQYPDTLKLTMKEKIRLKFSLYPSGPLGCGWQELGGHLGLMCQEIDMVEHFCLNHSYSPVDVLFHHWQSVHNKQTKQKLKDPDFVPVCPPCTKDQLIHFLLKMGRLDIIDSCNFKLQDLK